ncbi:hypothetical protein QJQ45_025305 [Haematococcus lacustris]|nr:hypothetical protein QJQ45_025305 [Haematococcus lacustris]
MSQEQGQAVVQTPAVGQSVELADNRVVLWLEPYDTVSQQAVEGSHNMAITRVATTQRKGLRSMVEYYSARWSNNSNSPQQVVLHAIAADKQAVTYGPLINKRLKVGTSHVWVADRNMCATCLAMQGGEEAGLLPPASAFAPAAEASSNSCQPAAPTFSPLLAPCSLTQPDLGPEPALAIVDEAGFPNSSHCAPAREVLGGVVAAEVADAGAAVQEAEANVSEGLEAGFMGLEEQLGIRDLSSQVQQRQAQAAGLCSRGMSWAREEGSQGRPSVRSGAASHLVADSRCGAGNMPARSCAVSHTGERGTLAPHRPGQELPACSAAASAVAPGTAPGPAAPAAATLRDCAADGSHWDSHAGHTMQHGNPPLSQCHSTGVSDEPDAWLWFQQQPGSSSQQPSDSHPTPGTRQTPTAPTAVSAGSRQLSRVGARGQGPLALPRASAATVSPGHGSQGWGHSASPNLSTAEHSVTRPAASVTLPARAPEPAPALQAELVMAPAMPSAPSLPLLLPAPPHQDPSRPHAGLHLTPTSPPPSLHATRRGTQLGAGAGARREAGGGGSPDVPETPSPGYLMRRNSQAAWRRACAMSPLTPAKREHSPSPAAREQEVALERQSKDEAHPGTAPAWTKPACARWASAPSIITQPHTLATQPMRLDPPHHTLSLPPGSPSSSSDSGFSGQQDENQPPSPSSRIPSSPLQPSRLNLNRLPAPAVAGHLPVLSSSHQAAASSASQHHMSSSSNPTSSAQRESLPPQLVQGAPTEPESQQQVAAGAGVVDQAGGDATVGAAKPGQGGTLCMTRNPLLCIRKASCDSTTCPPMPLGAGGVHAVDDVSVHQTACEEDKRGSKRTVRLRRKETVGEAPLGDAETSQVTHHTCSSGGSGSSGHHPVHSPGRSVRSVNNSAGSQAYSSASDGLEAGRNSTASRKRAPRTKKLTEAERQQAIAESQHQTAPCQGLQHHVISRLSPVPEALQSASQDHSSGNSGPQPTATTQTAAASVLALTHRGSRSDISSRPQQSAPCVANLTNSRPAALGPAPHAAAAEQLPLSAEALPPGPTTSSQPRLAPAHPPSTSGLTAFPASSTSPPPPQQAPGQQQQGCGTQSSMPAATSQAPPPPPQHPGLTKARVLDASAVSPPSILYPPASNSWLTGGGSPDPLSSLLGPGGDSSTAWGMQARLHGAAPSPPGHANSQPACPSHLGSCAEADTSHPARSPPRQTRHALAPPSPPATCSQQQAEQVQEECQTQQQPPPLAVGPGDEGLDAAWDLDQLLSDASLEAAAAAAASMLAAAAADPIAEQYAWLGLSGPALATSWPPSQLGDAAAAAAAAAAASLSSASSLETAATLQRGHRPGSGRPSRSRKASGVEGLGFSRTVPAPSSGVGRQAGRGRCSGRAQAGSAQGGWAWEGLAAGVLGTEGTAWGQVCLHPPALPAPGCSHSQGSASSGSAAHGGELGPAAAGSTVTSTQAAARGKARAPSRKQLAMQAVAAAAAATAASAAAAAAQAHQAEQQAARGAGSVLPPPPLHGVPACQPRPHAEQPCSSQWFQQPTMQQQHPPDQSGPRIGCYAEQSNLQPSHSAQPQQQYLGQGLPLSPWAQSAAHSCLMEALLCTSPTPLTAGRAAQLEDLLLSPGGPLPLGANFLTEPLGAAGMDGMMAVTPSRSGRQLAQGAFLVEDLQLGDSLHALFGDCNSLFNTPVKAGDAAAVVYN